MGRYRLRRPCASAIREEIKYWTRREIIARMDRLGIDPDDREQFLGDAFLQIAITLEADARIVVDDGVQALDLCWDWQWMPGEPPLKAVKVPAGDRPTRPFRLATTGTHEQNGADA